MAPHVEFALFFDPADIGGRRPLYYGIALILFPRALNAIGVRHADGDVFMGGVVQVVLS